MSDKLVFDLAQEVEGTPNVFVRKDWINILDNQNQNYNNNQSVIDTSQLSNSNKYMSYRESYFLMPFLISLCSYGNPGGTAAAQYPFQPLQGTYGADYAIGLKNWFGQIIHSFTLDYNGTTIIQQTPYVNVWNSFKLLTSLSLSDVHTQGHTIGFYPDDPTSWSFTPAVAIAANGTITAAVPAQSPSGQGVCNNTNNIQSTLLAGQMNNYNSGRGNIGILKRQQCINFDGDSQTGVETYQAVGAPYSFLLQGGTANASTAVWKSFVSNKINQAAGVAGWWQCSVVATIYLKHIHSFFNMCPLLKGVFMKMTMNLNNTSTYFQTSTINAAGGTVQQPVALTCSQVNNPLGGVNPLMIASGDVSGSLVGTTGAVSSTSNGGRNLFGSIADAGAGTTVTQSYRLNISVGSTCLDQTMTAVGGVSTGVLAKSVYLYIPAYTFNPVFEQAYLSSPVKQIKYTDIYQYQVLGVSPNQNFNNLLTNGIANIKSVLIIPFYSTNTSTLAPGAAINGVVCSQNTGFINGTPVFQSPFDPAGSGPTSPMCWISNFNIQVSGQNAIYNQQRYNFEQWNNQLYGQNAVNGGLTDGLTSGLIDRLGFDMEYCYYYVNVERMLPVEQSVPKSIQILGQNFSSRALDLYCFIEYGVDISIDALTGARV